MDIKETILPGVFVFESKKFQDERGFFSEVYRDDVLEQCGFDRKFIQDNHAYSADAGVLRGMHFQGNPFSQDKLIRVTRGAIWDVVVDMREGSPTYRKWIGEEISAANWKQILVPRGFAHGYATLEPDTEVVYKVSNYYAPEADKGFIWNDPEIGIDWKLDGRDPIISKKDNKLPRFKDLGSEFIYTA